MYTLDGSDPAVAGLPYTGPLTLPAQATLLRAQARQSCALPSETSQAIFRVTSAAPNPGSPPAPVQSSLHIGNSLTDTIVDYLEPLAQSGGVLLDFNRYTIPGAGTWMYAENPSGGFGVADVQLELKSRAFDHLTVQPFPNEPCQILASSAGPDSDSGFINQAWTDARTQNPDVQLWVYQQWPDPVDYTNCITGGGWVRADDVPSCGDVSSPSCWQPPEPASWEEAVQNELAYDEAIVDELVQLQPDAPRPYIVPGGLGLSHLHAAIDAGLVPGFTNFFGQIFQASGADIHLTKPGAYFISLIFYACMFQSNPSATELDASYGVTAEQARVLQAIAWETVTSYASSGVAR